MQLKIYINIFHSIVLYINIFSKILEYLRDPNNYIDENESSDGSDNNDNDLKMSEVSESKKQKILSPQESTDSSENEPIIKVEPEQSQQPPKLPNHPVQFPKQEPVPEPVSGQFPLTEEEYNRQQQSLPQPVSGQFPLTEEEYKKQQSLSQSENMDIATPSPPKPPPKPIQPQESPLDLTMTTPLHTPSSIRSDSIQMATEIKKNDENINLSIEVADDSNNKNKKQKS